MSEGKFAQQVKAVAQQIELHQHAAQSSSSPELLASTEGLQAALEELQVAAEELQHQHEELASTREAVEAERQRYQDLFESAPVGYLVSDLEGTIQAANQAAAKLLNLSQPFLIGKPLVIFVSQPDQQTFYSRLTQLIQGQSDRFEELELELRPRQSMHAAPESYLQPLAMALTVSIVPAQGGEPATLRWLLRDISEAKRREAERQRADAAMLRARMAEVKQTLEKEFSEAKRDEVVRKRAEQERQRMLSWRTVFLSSLSELRDVAALLRSMKQQLEGIVASDQQMQELLAWVSRKSRTLNLSYRPVVVRAFYLDLALARALDLEGTLDLARAFERDLTCNLSRPLALDLALDRALGLERVFNRLFDPPRVVARVLERALDHARALDPQLGHTLLQLQEQLAELDQDPETFRTWWQANGQAWTAQLRAVMIEYRDVGYSWQLNEQQRSALRQYYEANQLLAEGLRSRHLTPSVRNEIERTLLLPAAELEQPGMTVTAVDRHLKG